MSTQTKARDVLVLDPESTGALVIDVEEVILRTGPLRREAWRDVVDGALERRGGKPGVTADALERILEHDPEDGVDVVREVMVSRGVFLPVGLPHDPPEHLTAWGLRNRAELRFLALLERRGVEVLPGGGMLQRLKRAGLPLVAYSGSKVRLALWLVGFEQLFVGIMDGSDSEYLDLPRTPDPEALVLASELAGVEPAHAALITAAPEVAAAARRAGLSLVVGLCENGERELLAQSGADIVLDDLDEQVAVADPR